MKRGQVVIDIYPSQQKDFAGRKDNVYLGRTNVSFITDTPGCPAHSDSQTVQSSGSKIMAQAPIPHNTKS